MTHLDAHMFFDLAIQLVNMLVLILILIRLYSIDRKKNCKD